MDPIEFMPENSRDGTLGAVTLPGHSVDIPGLLIPSRLEGAEGGRDPQQSKERHGPLVSVYFVLAFPT